MELNYTIVPALDHEASARFFARIFWLHYDGQAGHFAPVQVNGSLTLDLDTATEFDSTTWPSRSATLSLMRSSPASRPRAFRMAADLAPTTTCRRTPGVAGGASISKTRRPHLGTVDRGIANPLAAALPATTETTELGPEPDFGRFCRFGHSSPRPGAPGVT